MQVVLRNAALGAEMSKRMCPREFLPKYLGPKYVGMPPHIHCFGEPSGAECSSPVIAALLWFTTAYKFALLATSPMLWKCVCGYVVYVVNVYGHDPRLRCWNS